jgi:hypothetical protein
MASRRAVGTAVGGVIGDVEGVLGDDQRYYVSERPVVYRSQLAPSASSPPYVIGAR